MKLENQWFADAVRFMAFQGAAATFVLLVSMMLSAQTPSPVSSPNDINKAPAAPTLSEITKLRVANAYKDAMLASAEVQRIQQAVIAASPDVQRAQAAFQKAADEYNQLVTKEAKEAKLPEGSVISVDPVTKEVSVKTTPPAEVKK